MGASSNLQFVEQEVEYTGAEETTSYTFTDFFTQTPTTNAGVVIMFNGLRLNDADYSISNRDLTLNLSVMGYALEPSDIIAASYAHT